MDTPTLARFFRASDRFRESLNADIALDQLDELRLENHLALLQMALIEWRCRKMSSVFPPLSPDEALPSKSLHGLPH